MKITNNDLIDKKFGTAFQYYGTFENQPLLNAYAPHVEGERAVPMVSSYSFDVGFVHFVVINSNTEYMYPEINTDEFSYFSNRSDDLVFECLLIAFIIDALKLTSIFQLSSQ